MTLNAGKTVEDFYTAVRVRDLTGSEDLSRSLNNDQDPDGHVQHTLSIAIVFTAVRQDGRWFIQDERAHFAGPIAS